MNTAIRSQYKIWRFKHGRSCKRWLTDERVEQYKRIYPHWRWQKIQVEDRSFQASSQTRSSQVSQSYDHRWGRDTAELRDSKRNNPHNSKISWDDILDVQLELKKGI